MSGGQGIWRDWPERHLPPLPPLVAKFLKKLKKFVIACHRAHTYKRLNLLPQPKRHLQRFGFVLLAENIFLFFFNFPLRSKKRYGKIALPLSKVEDSDGVSGARG